ncbi:MAG: hypothetical protein WCO75_04315 [Planctomycetota bacterium]
MSMAGEQDVYRVCVGDFRIVKGIVDSLLIVEVDRVGHRREAYR